jgi:hypothetical protein
MNLDRCLGLLYVSNNYSHGRGTRLYRLARKLEAHYLQPDTMPSGYYYLDRVCAAREYRSYSAARSWAVHYLRMIRRETHNV